MKKQKKTEESKKKKTQTPPPYSLEATEKENAFHLHLPPEA